MATPNSEQLKETIRSKNATQEQVEKLRQATKYRQHP